MRALIAVCIALLLTGSAAAQTLCAEGKTFRGACVKSDLAIDVDKTVRTMVQPKISYTAPPVLPQDDGYYSNIPRDANEIRTIYGLDRGADCTTIRGGAGPPVTVCR